MALIGGGAWCETVGGRHWRAEVGIPKIVESLNPQNRRFRCLGGRLLVRTTACSTKQPPIDSVKVLQLFWVSVVRQGPLYRWPHTVLITVYNEPNKVGHSPVLKEGLLEQKSTETV